MLSRVAYMGQKRETESSFGVLRGFLHLPTSITTSTAPTPTLKWPLSHLCGISGWGVGWSEFCVGIAPLGCDLFLFLAGLLRRLRWMVMLCRKWGPAMSTCQKEAITNPPGARSPLLTNGTDSASSELKKTSCPRKEGNGCRKNFKISP